MSTSVVLNTAIGLIFVFATASLVATGVVEYLSKRANKRGDYLLRGLREMLDIPPATPGAPTGAVALPTRGGLMDGDQTRSELNRLSTVGAELAPDMAAAPEASYRPPDPLADLVLAHPLVATMHRPATPGEPVSAVLRAPGRVRRWLRRATRGRYPERPTPRRDQMHLASYVSARTFATALIDLFAGEEENGADRLRRVHEGVLRLDETVPARAALLALLRDRRNDIDQFRAGLENWYDEQMDRVTGWYKRWVQWRLFVVGGVLAVVVNVDSLAVAQTLYRDEPVRHAVVAQAVASQGCPAEAGSARERCLAAQRNVLRDLPLPVGWGLREARADCAAYSDGRSCVRQPWLAVPFAVRSLRDNGLVGAALTLLGWLITAAAISFGAPFWFDLLNRLGSLRSAGRRPDDQAADRRGTASAQAGS